MSNGKTVSDKDSLKSRITAINRGVVSPKMIVNEAYAMAQALQGGSGGRTISDQDIKNILKKLKKGKKLYPIKMDKKGKPHLKKGGTIKVYAKGGGARKPRNVYE